MARLYEDFIDGTLTADPGASGTTLNAAVLANLPVVAGGDTMLLTLDPDQVGGAPEIVQVTAHTASATSATIVRAQEGTTGRAHDVGTRVVNMLAASDMETIQTDVTNLEALVETVEFGVAGTLAVTTGTFRWYAPENLDISRVTASVGVAPTGAAVHVDVHRNGTTIFTTQTLQPRIAAAGFFDASGTPDGTSTMTKDTDYLTVDIDQIGSTVAGDDLLVVVEYTRT